MTMPPTTTTIIVRQPTPAMSPTVRHALRFAIRFSRAYITPYYADRESKVATALECPDTHAANCSGGGVNGCFWDRNAERQERDAEPDRQQPAAESRLLQWSRVRGRGSLGRKWQAARRDAEGRRGAPRPQSG